MQYNEDRLTHITEQHWKEYCPKMWAILISAGTADSEARTAAKGTMVAMEQLMGTGYTEDQAWEMTREDWILLKEEEEEEEIEGIEYPLYNAHLEMQEIDEELIAEEEGRA